MYKIAVLGDYNSIYGFAALGLDTFPVEDPQEGREKLNRLAADEYHSLLKRISEPTAVSTDFFTFSIPAPVFPAIPGI